MTAGYRLLTVSCLAALVAGCGGGELSTAELVPVSGKALLPDGKPAKFVWMEFYALDAVSPMGTATTDAAGKFTPTTVGKPGLARGEQRVAVRATPKTGAKLDPALESDSTSPLRMTVAPGAEVTITLQTP